MSAQRIRDLLAAGHPLMLPGVYDALSARLAEQAGFAASFVSGYAVSASRLAAPDVGYLTQTEMAQTAREVCAATSFPVIVDADTGYGNALSAIRTARDLFAAGAGGLFLEDQQWPKKCGHFPGKRVVDTGEWLAKLRAVLDLRADGVDLYVVARTDARAAVTLEEAITRARAAQELGVDAIFVEAPQSVAELEAVTSATPGAVRVANMVEGGRTPLLTADELHDLGYDLIVTPLTALLSATRAMRAAFTTLAREGTMRGHTADLLDFTAFGEVVGLAAHRGLEVRYAAAPRG